MTCKICKGRKIQSLGKENIYCPDCGAHYYKGKWWTKKEWENWINSD